MKRKICECHRCFREYETTEEYQEDGICPTCKRELLDLFNDVFYGGMKLRKVTCYMHHGNKVFVREDLKGKHRQYCLCYHCKHYSADRKKNCLISNAIYANCVKYGLVTPVFECPEFEQIGDIYSP